VILLVRHAVAVPRRTWEEEDASRPLSRRGTRQADALVGLLEGLPVERVVSSPTARCKATVGPLARDRGLAVKTSKLLREGHGDDGLDLVLDNVGDVVLCTHGDVIEVVLAGLRRLGWPVPSEPHLAKGSAWLLQRAGDCRYLPPSC
jgi:8-oxo-dGTP diphosphatase